MTLSEKRKRALLDRLNDPAWCKTALDAARHQRENPYEHSQLRYWLSLEKWDFGEGLLILAGVEPGTIRSGAPAFTLEEDLDRFEWENAALFGQTEEFFQFDYDPFAPLSDDLRRELEEKSEEKREIIGRHWKTYASLKHRALRTLQPFGDSLEPRARGISSLDISWMG
jgi:hypothetical protein